MKLPRAVALAKTAAEEKKGLDILCLDLKGLSSVTDWFLLVTGRNTNHTRAVADGIMEVLGEQEMEPYRRQGYQEGRWILLDYLNFVVHIMTAETRDYYQLERLWRKV